MIKKYRGTHSFTACKEYHEHRQASSWVIGEAIKDRYEGIGCIYRPKDIIKEFQVKHGVSISYGKAWRARESAIDSVYGSPEQSFAVLPSYLAQLQVKNPGSVTHIERDTDNRFKYLFMALGASLRGFRTSIRPVIAVDATHLKGKYLGTLFIATCLDGNNQVYPLAFGVGDSENDASWTWFFEKLRGAIVNVEELVFISDRHKSIEKAIRTIFPDALHGVCMYHIQQNLSAKNFTEAVNPLFYKAAKAYRECEFNHIMSQIRSMEGGRVYTYLQEAGFHRWARAFFPGHRYNVMTTNIAECLNGILRDARGLPVTMLLESIRSMLQRWFYERREAALKMPELTLFYDDIATARREKSQNYNIRPINLYEFLVDGGGGGHVDLANKTCTCRVFDVDRFPCVHTFAACRSRHMPPIGVCSMYYKTETLLLAYAESIYPVLLQDAMAGSDGSAVLLPPKSRRPGGRPKKRRIPSNGEARKKRMCSRCKGLGHNRQSCREPISLT